MALAKNTLVHAFCVATREALDNNIQIMQTIRDIRNLPVLSSDTIQIWGVHVPAMLNRLDEMKGFLSDKEQDKVRRFHRDTDRQSSIAARGALRLLLSVYTGIPASEIEFGYCGNGKPYVADSEVEFNVSHSGEWVVLAIGRSRNIGVDIEMINRELDVMAIASRYFTPEEIARIENSEDRHAEFFQLWARKEAYVKACGSTLFRELRSFAIPAGDGEKDGWHFCRLEAGSKYVAAVVTDNITASVPCFDFGGLKWES